MLMAYEIAGDPMSSLKWTRKTTEKIATELEFMSIFVSKTTVARLLRQMDFSLKSNSKKISNGGKHVSTEEQKKRNKQFKYLERKRREYEKKGDPVISVDTKKKELIGNFKNSGTRLKRQADLTNDHDYLSYALGKAALYGIYDTVKNNAYVRIGKFLREGNSFSSSDTPQFAVESIAEWWTKNGNLAYPHSTKLLILADAGGSNGYKPHMWKVNIQKILCDQLGLEVTVLHFPPGASKWNPIERRLFSFISNNWKGTPLKTYETVLKYVRSTTTKVGLTVKARLVSKKYISGIKATENDLNSLRIKANRSNPMWNYTLVSNN